jgi:hypothetical protein
MLLTLLTGAGAPDLDALLERIRERHPELELDVQARRAAALPTPPLRG